MTVEIQRVSKYYGAQKALDDISFTLRKGELVGFLGPNGAGKSTLMKIITGFLSADEGEVLINGEKVSGDHSGIKRLTGYLPENNPLYTDLYVSEYLDIVAGLYRLANRQQRVKEMMELTGLGPERHKKIGSLSKGYRQRVGLAQALIHDPQVVILDEPTSGLDPNQLNEIRAMISEISKEKTVLLSSHILQEIEAICPRVVILMTAYLAFNAIKDRKLAPDARPPVSQAAWKAIGSRMFVDPGKPATVEELLRGLIVQSGNDAAIILAEALGGSEAGFATQMNREAARIGMKNTNFTNASGLPDAQHYTTARDLAILSSRLIEEHPDFYRIYSEREYTYNNIKQPNRNRLLFIDPTVDGVKTGHTDAAGYCLIASSKREQPGAGFQRRLLSVVLGTASETARAIESQKLLNYGFANFDVVRLYQKEASAASYQVWKGAAKEVKAGFANNVLVTVARGQGERVKGEIERMQPLVAPIAKGQPIGTLRVRLDDKVIAEQPLIALEAVEQAGWFGRLWDTIRLWFK